MCIYIYITISLFTHPSLECCALVAQSYLTLCDPMDCRLQAPLSMGILQTRILEWVAMPSSRGSSQPKDQTQVSHRAGRFFTIWANREAHCKLTFFQYISYCKLCRSEHGDAYLFKIILLFSFSKCPDMEILDHIIVLSFYILKYLHSILDGTFVNLHYPPIVQKCSSFSISLPTFSYD